MKRNLTEKVIMGLIFAGAVYGGVSFAADSQNSYTDKGQTVEKTFDTSLRQGGEIKVILSKVEPSMTLSKWNGEIGLRVKYAGVQASGSVPAFSDQMQWKDGTKEVHAYPLAPTSQMEDGGMEFEVVLTSPPTSNVFTFTIENTQDLLFIYQGALNDEWGDPTCTPTDCNGEHRPDNIVGSYAVYHKYKANHAEGQTNYGTGKAYHIFRPKIIDANGKWEWGSLKYTPDQGLLRVTASQQFLDTATYPVTIDPTFGYTTIGATTGSGINDGNAFFTNGTPAGGNGTVDDIQAYGNSTAASWKGVIWLKSSDAIITNGVSDIGTMNSGTNQWWVATYTTKPSVTNGTVYQVGMVISAAGALNRDTCLSAAPPNCGFDNNSYATPANLTSPYSNDTRMYSIYADYTASATASTPHVILRQGVLKAGKL